MADPVRLRLGVFSPSVVLGVAAASGAWERAGLMVEEVPVTSSTQQFTALLAGELDAVFTSPDNVLAYRGTASNPLGRAADVRILAAVDRGLGLSLFAGPGVRSVDDLRGGVLAVDVPTSGFAFVAYELLARQGMRAGHDYEVAAFGSTPRRAAALVAGKCATTVLNAGNDLRAEAAGCTRLSRASSLGRYLGTVLAAPAGGVREKSSPLRNLTEVVLATARALAEGRLAELAGGVTASRLGLAPDGVRRYLETLSDPDEGLVPDGRLDAESLATLRRLRSRYAGGDRELATLVAPGSGLVDDRFLPSAAT
ncbi:ABC transporter substrate-binding protein [Plantactinospora soyae]|uniref:ABC-type nitrate/sulfonate/bicarbonate transport system substrate-binding protein n=1 Tax=Plantactinospora soyae TaxID=1544732 RepID=A0A927MD40_9ACTN|nr:PhnD/SsuA/transferrin family substrate-binding protein [Plantactinospora soyae]MBE1491562.1 ABC-type nitrate/sulfonate/bicarbonate transport system substrate-binding protein [Plantactinospora soyae]